MKKRLPGVERLRRLSLRLKSKTEVIRGSGHQRIGVECGAKFADGFLLMSGPPENLSQIVMRTSKIAIGAAVGRGRFALLIAAMALACLIAGIAALAASLALVRS